MRFGICIGNDWDQLPKLRDYGYDYAELNLASLADKTEDEIEKARALMEQTGIYGETCNGFFFSFEMGYLTSDKVDFAVLEEYIRRAFTKGSRLGLRLAVIGSGSARYIPGSVDREVGEERFARVLRLAGDIGAEFGIRIVIEPLNQKETNLVNTVADCLAMCQRVNHPNVGTLADFFHVSMTGESLDTIRTCGEKLWHVHIARNNKDRQMPIMPEDEADVAAWAAALKENGYDARISLEGGMWEDWDDTAKKMRQVLRQFE